MSDRGLCLGGCGQPRRWPWITCGRTACYGGRSTARLAEIKREAGRKPRGSARG